MRVYELSLIFILRGNMGLGDFFSNTRRIFLVAKKPTSEEYWNLVKVVGLGIVILGLIGFLLLLIIKIFYAPV